MLINSGGKKRNRGRPPKAKQEPGIDGDINSSQTQNPAKKPRRAVKNQTSIINTRHRNNTRQSVNTNQSRGVMFASRTNMSPAPLLNKSNFKYPPAKTTPMVAARAILDQSITKSELKRMGNRYLKLHDPYTLFALDDEYDQQVASTNEQIASTDITDGIQMGSAGDLIQFMEGKDKIKGFQKRAGKTTDRANDQNFRDNNTDSYNYLVQKLNTYLEATAKVLHPVNHIALIEDLKTIDVRAPCLDPKVQEKIDNLFKSSLKQRSPESRIIKALIEYLYGNGTKGTTLRAMSKPQRLKDMAAIMNGEKFCLDVLSSHTRRKKSDEVIENVVKFILSPDNVQMLSWGVRKVRLGKGVVYELPKIVRRCQKQELWNRYNKLCKDADKNDRIQRTTFLKIAGCITSGDYKLISCVDYVQGNLVDDPVEKLQDVIDCLFSPLSAERKEFTSLLTFVRHFLKVEFDRHVRMDDGDGFHSLSHSLSKKKHDNEKYCRHDNCKVCENLSSNGLPAVNCVGCKFPFWFCDELLKHVKRAKSSVVVQQSSNISEGGQSPQGSSSQVNSSTSPAQEALQYESSPVRRECIQEGLLQSPTREEQSSSQEDASPSPSTSPTQEALDESSLVGGCQRYWCAGPSSSQITQNVMESVVDGIEELDEEEIDEAHGDEPAAQNEIRADDPESQDGYEEDAIVVEEVTEDEEEVYEENEFTDEPIEMFPEIDDENHRSDNTVSDQEDEALRRSDQEDEAPTREEQHASEYDPSHGGSYHLPLHIYNTLEQITQDDMERVIDDMSDKFKIFMLHRHRVKNQRNALDQVEIDMETTAKESRRFSSQMLVVIDFKMKFEAMNARETMPENFGKRGMGWHGAALMYYEWDDILDKAVRKLVYIDQILDKNSKQDASAVISLLEAIIAASRAIFGERFIPEAILCSDNAGCYQAKLLILCIGFLNANNKDVFFIRKIIHSETQDGKGLVDAHFAMCMRHLLKYMKTNPFSTNKIRHIKTPRGLAYALAWADGVVNSIVQLVEIDRVRMQKITEFWQPYCKEMGKYFSRACEIEFVLPTEEEKALVSKCNWEADVGDYPKELDGFRFMFKALAHSGYGQEVGFTVGIDSDGGFVMLDEYGESERRKFLGIDEESSSVVDNGIEEEGEESDMSSIDTEPSDHLDEDSDPFVGGPVCDDSEYIYESDENDFEVGSEDSDSESDSESDSDDEFENNTVEIEDSVCPSDGDVYFPGMLKVVTARLYAEPDKEAYKQDTFFSGIKIVKVSNVPISNVVDSTKVKENLERRRRKEKQNREKAKDNRQDCVARAVRFAFNHISDTSNDIRDTGSDFNEIYQRSKHFSFPLSKLPSAGFARRDGDAGADLLGARYVDEHRAFIKAMIDRGNRDSSNKAQPAQILEEIKIMYPNRLVIPTEYEVRTTANAIIQEQKKNGHSTNTNSNKKRKEPFDEEVEKWMYAYMKRKGNFLLKPMVVFEEVKKQFPDLLQRLDFEDEKELSKKTRAKIGAMRAKLRNDAYKSSM